MRCGIIKRLSTSAGNGTFIASNACQKQIHYANWSQNCTTHHADREPNNHGSNANTDGNGGNDGNDDADRIGKQRTAGVSDVVLKEIAKETPRSEKAGAQSPVVETSPEGL